MKTALAAPPPLILVVDDEPLIRWVNADVLTDAGFTVIQAANGDEALELLESHRDVRVVFTDVEMPGLIDGFALAGRIHRQWPEIGVVVTSGRRCPAAALDSKMQCFLPKPYSLDHVVRAIGEALNKA
ncbi:MAG: response regulator [Beijerinckiaceae bacterium]|nr:response regulator [Beijerinckiaceae bacterium]